MGLRKQHNCDCRKAQQNADEEAKFKEGGLRSGFLFHWVEFGAEWTFADTLQARINAVSGVWLISLGSNGGTPFLSESGGTCQHYFCLRFGSPLRRVPKTQRGIGLTFYRQTPVAAPVSAAKKHWFCKPSCARYRAKFAGHTLASTKILACRCASVWPLLGITFH